MKHTHICNYSEIMELSVLDEKGKETGRKIKLDQAVFGIDPNNHAIYLDVKQHLANRRQVKHLPT